MSDSILPIIKPLICMSEAEAKVMNLLDKLCPPHLDEIGVRFINPLEMRQTILDLEQAMNEASDVQLQIKTTHRFIDGIYAREVFIPAGTLLVGRIHRHACISIMNSGLKTTITEDGAMKIKAPFATISKPGIKRVGFAHEDTIWTTIHATNERDLAKLEDELFVDKYDGVEFKDSDVMTLFTMEGKLCQQ